MGASDGAPANPIRPERVNQAGRPTAVELERRKKRVMEVATDLFVTHGYTATSLVDIAKGAGVATRTLYQHFGDKEALFREVVFARDIGAIVPVPLLPPEDTLAGALARVADYCLAVALSRRSVELMRLMVAERNRFPELMRGVATATLDRFRRKVAKLFEELEGLGLMPADDHLASADLFIDLILGNAPIMTYADWRPPPSPDHIERRIDFFILGMFGPDGARQAQSRTGTLPVGRAA